MGNINEQDVENPRIMLGLLDAVDQNQAQSQRHLASELGIALGLVNAYIKRCIKKGLVKVRHAPARRYSYYLTPQGFTEKSRLTVEYLSVSFGFFRQAKTHCSDLLRQAKTRGINKVVLIGQSDLAEIAALCALEQAVEIVGLVQEGAAQSQFIGLPVFDSVDDISAPFDAVLITALSNSREACEMAIARFGSERVLVPNLLRAKRQRSDEAAA
jgi:DNA-binding MarR family transcriptional regulator